jgi:hypothetical protein
MKYANIALTLILILLAVIAWKLLFTATDVKSPASGQDQPLLASQQALVNSIQRLETQFTGLRQELADFREKVLKK